MSIRKAGVVGCGLMGSGIAQTCAQSGYETVVREVNQEKASSRTDRSTSIVAVCMERSIWKTLPIATW